MRRWCAQAGLLAHTFPLPSPGDSEVGRSSPRYMTRPVCACVCAHLHVSLPSAAAWSIRSAEVPACARALRVRVCVRGAFCAGGWRWRPPDRWWCGGATLRHSEPYRVCVRRRNASSMSKSPVTHDPTAGVFASEALWRGTPCSFTPRARVCGTTARLISISLTVLCPLASTIESSTDDHTRAAIMPPRFR
jgi:hypothetical protein